MVEMRNLVHKNHFPELIQMGVDTCARVHACLEAAVLETAKAAFKCS
jgi:hypothetical protein